MELKLCIYTKCKKPLHNYCDREPAEETPSRKINCYLLGSGRRQCELFSRHFIPTIPFLFIYLNNLVKRVPNLILIANCVFFNSEGKKTTINTAYDKYGITSVFKCSCFLCYLIHSPYLPLFY